MLTIFSNPVGIEDLKVREVAVNTLFGDSLDVLGHSNLANTHVSRLSLHVDLALAQVFVGDAIGPRITSKVNRTNVLDVQADKGGLLGQILVSMQAIDELQLVRALSTQLELPLLEEISQEEVFISGRYTTSYLVERAAHLPSLGGGGGR